MAGNSGSVAVGWWAVRSLIVAPATMPGKSFRFLSTLSDACKGGRARWNVYVELGRPAVALSAFPRRIVRPLPTGSGGDALWERWLPDPTTGIVTAIWLTRGIITMRRQTPASSSSDVVSDCGICNEALKNWRESHKIDQWTEFGLFRVEVRPVEDSAWGRSFGSFLGGDR